MTRTKPALALLLALGAIAGLLALRTRDQAAAQPGTPAAADEVQAIRAAAAGVVAAYNKADIEALMGFWTPDADYTDEDGTQYKGRDAIAGLFKQAFAAHKGAKMSLVPKSLRFLKPDVAVAEGSNVLTPADGGPGEPGRYHAVYVKVEGKWLLASVRDLPAPPTPSDASKEQLKPLDWMVGEWATGDNGPVVTLNVTRAPGGVALLLEFTLKRPDGELSVITGRVGYDPNAESLRIWQFDSTGGFGGGLAVRQGNKWVIENEGVLPDGRTGSSTDTYQYVNDHTFVIKSQDRTVDDQPVPDVEIKFTKKTTGGATP